MYAPSVINNFIDSDDIVLMINTIESLDRWESEHDSDSRTLIWNPNNLNTISFIKKYYPQILSSAELENLYPHVIGFYKYLPGNGMGVHSDIMDDNCRDCKLSAVIYLNDNYSGGEIYFPKLNISIKPTAGSVIFYPAYLSEFDHGVKPIGDGYRYAIPMCFTTNIELASLPYV